MYALIHNNEIKVGPRDYTFSFFRDYLIKQNILFDLPYEFSGDRLEISSNIKIIKVQDPIIPTYNHLIEQLSGPYYDLTVEPVSAFYGVAPIAIDSIKNTLIALAATERRKKELSSFTMTIQGQDVIIHTDKEERATWHQLLSVIGDGVVKFKFSPTLWLDLVLSDVQSVIAAISNHVQSAFVWEAGINDEIKLSNSPEELIVIHGKILPVVTNSI